MSKTNKKLIYLNQTLGMGGAEVFMNDLLVELQKIGWEILVYTNNSRFQKMLTKSGVKTKKINTVVDIIGDWKGLLKGLVLWPKLAWEYWQVLIDGKNSDIFLLSGFIEKIIFSPLAVLKNKSIAWIEFGPMETIFTKFLGLPKFLYFLVKSLPKTIITSSLNSEKSLISSAQIPASKLEVIACGRNLKIKKTSSTKNLVICVSRLENGKGQDILVRAFRKVVDKVPKAKLKIVGEGDFKKEIEAEIKRQKLQKNICVVGRVKDSLKELAKAEVVVFPSVWPLEGFGLVMIEAMSLGKPVVAFKNGPAPEIIKDGVNGLLAKSHDPDDLAEKIIALLYSQKLKNKLSKQAQLDFEKKYQISKVAKKYDQAILSI